MDKTQYYSWQGSEGGQPTIPPPYPSVTQQPPQSQIVTQQPQHVMIQQPGSTVYANPQVMQQLNTQALPVSPQPAVFYQQTVVSNQPATIVAGQQQLREWSTGMCDCFEDMHSCICAWFFPHCFAGCLATRMNESCCVPCGVPGGMITMRTALRTKHGIKGDICGDCCDSFWCGLCVLCQMSREMDKLGYPKSNCC